MLSLKEVNKVRRLTRLTVQPQNSRTIARQQPHLLKACQCSPTVW
uniref:Uncharacterized protein n=1 Tax=Rhizophora mucronata TaxID=61149 RepID=A0A2P2MXW0_RHIMU